MVAATSHPRIGHSDCELAGRFCPFLSDEPRILLGACSEDRSTVRHGEIGPQRLSQSALILLGGEQCNAALKSPTAKSPEISSWEVSTRAPGGARGPDNPRIDEVPITPRRS